MAIEWQFTLVQSNVSEQNTGINKPRFKLRFSISQQTGVLDDVDSVR